MSLFIFKDIHHVIIAEDILKNNGISSVMVPLPKKYAPDCGMALEIAEQTGEHALSILEKSNAAPVKVIDSTQKSH